MVDGSVTPWGCLLNTSLILFPFMVFFRVVEPRRFWFMLLPALPLLVRVLAEEIFGNGTNREPLASVLCWGLWGLEAVTVPYAVIKLKNARIYAVIIGLFLAWCLCVLELIINPITAF